MTGNSKSNHLGAQGTFNPTSIRVRIFIMIVDTWRYRKTASASRATTATSGRSDVIAIISISMHR